MRSRLMLIPFAAILASCGGSGTTSPTPPAGGGGGGGGGNPVVTTAVEMKNIAFTPAAIRVSPSATVTFTNSDNFNHNATFDAAAIGGTGSFATGSKTVTMPAAAGTYAFHCTIHPGMTGTVQVQ